MSIDVARAVLVEAAQRQVYKEGIPERDEDIMEAATMIVKLAQEAYDAGSRNEDLVAVISMSQPNDDDYRTFEDVITDAKARLAGAKSRITKEKLPEPNHVGDDVMDVPRDVTKLSNEEIRRLYSERGACYDRTAWLLAVEKSDRDRAQDMAKLKLAKAMSSIEWVDEKGKALGVNALKEVAAADPEYQEWMKRYIRHAKEVRQLEALASVYENEVSRLSREWTMRTASFEMSGGQH